MMMTSGMSFSSSSLLFSNSNDATGDGVISSTNAAADITNTVLLLRY